MSETPPLQPYDEDDMLAAELVLGLLPQEEHTAVAMRARQEPVFAAAVTLWQERLVTLLDDVDPVKPPRRVRKALRRRLFADAPVPLGKRLWVWQGLTYAALAVAGYLAVQMYAMPPELPLYGTQMSSAESPVQVVALYDPARNSLSLNRVEGAAAEGRDLEVWVIAPGADPVSLGLLPRDQAQARLPVPAQYVAQAAVLTLAVSDEPAGGSTTGLPTGPVIAVGTLAQL